jgi:FkbM family methyltransferase
LALRALKQAVKRVLRARGLAITPYDDYEARLAPVRDDWFRALGIRTVIDVGANDGGFARRARALLPDAALYCFEPLPGPYARLCERFADDSRFKAARLALSRERGTAVFHENASSGSSSLLPMAELHREAYPFTRGSTTVEVECSTLDDCFRGIDLEANVLLKMDVQGGEQMVLDGGPETLRRTMVVFSELSFFELYHGQPLATEVMRAIGAAGFTLAGIENVSRSLVDGRFLQCDGYFLRDQARALLTRG